MMSRASIFQRIYRLAGFQMWRGESRDTLDQLTFASWRQGHPIFCFQDSISGVRLQGSHVDLCGLQPSVWVALRRQGRSTSVAEPLVRLEVI